MLAPEARLWAKKQFEEIFPALGPQLPHVAGQQRTIGGVNQAQGQGQQPPHQPPATGGGAIQMDAAILWEILRTAPATGAQQRLLQKRMTTNLKSQKEKKRE